MKKRNFWFLFAFLVTYNFLTLLFSAWNEGYVHDEPFYVVIGQGLLDGDKSVAGWGHPPLAIWTGAFLPWLLGNVEPFHPVTLFYSRLSHVFLTVFSGAGMAYWIFRLRGEFAALLFLLLYSTLGLLKFGSSHHLIDTDGALYATLSLFWLWALPPKTLLGKIGPLLLFFFASLCKVSMVVVAPFVFGFLLWREVKVPAKLKLLLPTVLALLLALSISYLFQVENFRQYFEILRLQFHRSISGSPNSLLGQRIDSGAWYYYLVILFFKSPLAWTFLLLWSLGATIKLKAKKEDVWFFLLPGITLLILFSHSTLQLGFRYITLSVLLFTVFSSITVGNLKVFETRKWPSFFALLILFLGTDLYTLSKDSYQTYFNFLAPRPPINFTDSNVDWHQKVPRHLEPETPVALQVQDYLDFLLDPKKSSEIFHLPSMELNAIWRHPAGVLFRGLTPFLTVAGHEFHRVNKETLFQLFMERPPFHSAGTNSFKTWDAPFETRSTCSSGNFSIKSQSLFDLQGALRSIPNELNEKDFEGVLNFGPRGKALIVIESNNPIDVKGESAHGTFTRGPSEEYRNYAYWFPLEVAKPTERALFHFEKRGKFPNLKSKARMLQLWSECEGQVF